MAGGDEAVFARVKPLFELMGKNITLVGGNGDGQTCKVANQIIVALNIEAVGEALLFATLHDMRAMEYGYAIIGGIGPEAFYRRWLDVSVIPGSQHGIYRGMLHSPGDAPPDEDD